MSDDEFEEMLHAFVGLFGDIPRPDIFMRIPHPLLGNRSLEEVIKAGKAEPLLKFLQTHLDEIEKDDK